MAKRSIFIGVFKIHEHIKVKIETTRNVRQETVLEILRVIAEEVSLKS